MIAALDMHSVTLDPPDQPPAIMVELDSASDFESVLPLAGDRRPFLPAPIVVPRDAKVALTDLLFLDIDPVLALAQELREKVKRALADQQSYKVRIEALRADAAQDGYGLNAVSERDFWQFIRSEPFVLKGNLVLMDNGNLRSVWKGEHGTHIGLQFLGGRMVQYVIFKRRGAAAAVSRVAGRDTFDGVKRQIQAFDLRPLIFA
jgi:hypothetical protein